MAVPEPTPLSRRSASAPPRDQCPWCGQAVTHERFLTIQKRIRDEERRRAREQETRLRAEFARERSAAQAAQLVAIEEARRAGQAAAEAAANATLNKERKARAKVEHDLEDERTKQDQVLSVRLREQRKALKADHDKALRARDQAAFAERAVLATEVEQLRKRLASSEADAGEGAGLDLFDELRAAFPEDRIKRAGAQRSGASLVHEVRVEERILGLIVYDDRPRQAWRDGYVRSLRRDQQAAGAQHAMIATAVMPSGTRQLAIRDGIIIASPARVVLIAQILRDHIVELDRARVSHEEKHEKTAALYAFITSERCAKLFDDVHRTAETILELDVAEKRAHKTTWDKRGDLVRSLQQTHGRISAEVSRIIGTTTSEAR
jgi:hypothetical protein